MKSTAYERAILSEARVFAPLTALSSKLAANDANPLIGESIDAKINNYAYDANGGAIAQVLKAGAIAFVRAGLVLDAPIDDIQEHVEQEEGTKL